MEVETRFGINLGRLSGGLFGRSDEFWAFGDRTRISEPALAVVLLDPRTTERAVQTARRIQASNDRAGRRNLVPGTEERNLERRTAGELFQVAVGRFLGIDGGSTVDRFDHTDVGGFECRTTPLRFRPWPDGGKFGDKQSKFRVPFVTGSVDLKSNPIRVRIYGFAFGISIVLFGREQTDPPEFFEMPRVLLHDPALMKSKEFLSEAVEREVETAQAIQPRAVERVERMQQLRERIWKARTKT